MGGWGSGRRGGYDTTEGYRRLDVRKLQRESMLDQRYSFNWQWLRDREVVGFITIRPLDDRIILAYNHRQGGYGEWTPMEYPVEIERTRCHFGGERVWFRCPAVGCRRRVAVLYGAKHFVCRNCYRLAYPCQRQTRSDRATNRAYALRERACDWGTIFEPILRRKGMHRKTFERIASEYYKQVRVSLTAGPNRIQFPPAIHGQHAEAVQGSYARERSRLATQLVREGTNRLRELKMKMTHAKRTAAGNTTNNTFNAPVGNAFINSSVVQTTNNLTITAPLLQDIDSISEGHPELQAAALELRNAHGQNAGTVEKFQEWATLAVTVQGLAERIHQYYPHVASLHSQWRK